jgi:hypothetical protein
VLPIVKRQKSAAQEDVDSVVGLEIDSAVKNVQTGKIVARVLDELDHQRNIVLFRPEGCQIGGCLPESHFFFGEWNVPRFVGGRRHAQAVAREMPARKEIHFADARRSIDLSHRLLSLGTGLHAKRKQLRTALRCIRVVRRIWYGEKNCANPVHIADARVGGERAVA